MKKTVVITGSMGLIGFETTKLFLDKGFIVVGVDNDIRAKLFSIKTKYKTKLNFIKDNYRSKYVHYHQDIRDYGKLKKLIKAHKDEIALIVHTAAQTSHDWSAKDPETDFSINTLSTLRLLDLYKKYCSEATFIFTSTNKVYGDAVNSFSYKKNKKRFDLDKKNKYYHGITEDLSIDQSKHSLFGVSKASADLLVQEYGRYFNLKTGVFRLGVIAGAGQNGALEQGFLSYMMDRFINHKDFCVIGYKGMQVRDILDARDLAQAFYFFYKSPKKGEVFNMGGGRENSASILELIEEIRSITKRNPEIKYENKIRSGDHKWWITNYSKFKKFYPGWRVNYSVKDIILDIYKKSNGL